MDEILKKKRTMTLNWYKTKTDPSFGLPGVI